MKEKDRIDFAILISNMLEWPQYKESSGCPYRPNPSDFYYWTLDSGNNWKVKFYEDNQTIEIYHRYQMEKEVKCLCDWLICKFGLKEVV